MIGLNLFELDTQKVPYLFESDVWKFCCSVIVDFQAIIKKKKKTNQNIKRLHFSKRDTLYEHK